MRKTLQKKFTDEDHTLNATDAASDLQYLWWRVLSQSVVDADNLDNANVTKRNQAKAAIIWLQHNPDDFYVVCALANVDADAFRIRANKWLETRFPAELLRSVYASPR